MLLIHSCEPSAAAKRMLLSLHHHNDSDMLHSAVVRKCLRQQKAMRLCVRTLTCRQLQIADDWQAGRLSEPPALLRASQYLGMHSLLQAH